MNRIAYICEDASDYRTIKVITGLIAEGKRYSQSGRCAGGCGNLLNKCTRYAENLFHEGCNLLIVVLDLDGKDRRKMESDLYKKICNIKFKNSVIVLPRQEIESWLLSSGDPIRKTFGIKKFKLPYNPERLQDPKRYIHEICRKNHKTYLNTLHNERMAAHLDVEKLMGLESSKNYVEFIRSNLK